MYFVTYRSRTHHVSPGWQRHATLTEWLASLPVLFSAWTHGTNRVERFRTLGRDIDIEGVETMDRVSYSRKKEIRDRIRFSISLFVLLVIKPFKFLHKFVPERGQGFLKFWSYRMLWIPAISGGKRVLADTPSTVTLPKSFAPLVETEERYKLTEEQIRSFFENGFISGLKAAEPDEAAEMLAEIKKAVDKPSRIYNMKTDRDRHLDCPEVLRIVRLPAIAETAAQIMGEDLQAWRGAILAKAAMTPETAWHQVTQFILSGKSFRPLIIPQDINELFNLTVWIALEDTDEENGCLQFLRGSHLEPIHKMRIGEGENFGDGNRFLLEADIDPKRVVDARLKAGEFVMFHERCIHAGRAMTHPTRTRWAMNIRICRPDVKVYHEMKEQVGFTFHQKYDLSKWGVVQIRGEDRFGYNRHADLSHERAYGKLAG